MITYLCTERLLDAYKDLMGDYFTIYFRQSI